jgi:hypothetical protein
MWNYTRMSKGTGYDGVCGESQEQRQREMRMERVVEFGEL